MVISYYPTLKPQAGDHPLSALRDCLVNIFVATLYIWTLSSLSRTRGRVIMNSELGKVQRGVLMSDLETLTTAFGCTL